MAPRKRLVRPKYPSVLQILKKSLNYQEPIRSAYKQTRVHASSLGYMCTRAEVLISALIKAGAVEPVEESTLDRAFTFALGTAMHSAFQNEIVEDLHPHFVGVWECRQCHYLHGSRELLVPQPSQCEGCNLSTPPKEREVLQPGQVAPKYTSFEYKEIRVENTEFRISGYMDGLLRFPEADGDGVFELKSIGRKFDEVKMVPMMEHVIQIQVYLWLLNLKWGLILYWGKQVYANPLIEHYVERDDETIAAIQEQLRTLWSCIESGVLPDRICRSADCKRAEQCPVALQCFGEGTEDQPVEAAWDPEV